MRGRVGLDFWTAADARRRLVRLVSLGALSAGAAFGILFSSPANAGVALSVAPAFPGTVAVGATNQPASLAIRNQSTGAEAAATIVITDIQLNPACSSPTLPCASPDVNAFNIDPGVGRAGTACAGLTFIPTEQADGTWLFAPSASVVLGTPGSSTDTCVIDFTFDVLNAPTTDFNPAVPGVQAQQVARATGTNSPSNNSIVAYGYSQMTVVAGQPSIVTQTNPTSGPIGTAFTDTATVSGLVNPSSGAGAGTVTFTAYGPNDATCAGAPVFTSPNRPLTMTSPSSGTATSAPFTPTSAGTYRWIAQYSGDANNSPVTSPCNAANETFTVTAATPTLTTQASPSVPVGGQIYDTATLSGGANPTGTITFNTFGPNDSTCTGAPAFTSTVPVNGNGNYQSGPFTTTQAGTYRWVATYSGDANNISAGPTACQDPAEQTVVTAASPTISTQASPGGVVGTQVTDTATLSGGYNPTGTITFTLYGPDDATCAGPAAYTSTVPVNGNGNYTSSPPFTPSAPGTYRWIATYSGDANNAIAGPTACNDPNEDVVITAPPSIQVTKTANPLSRPEPGGDFTFTVVITNTGSAPVTITSITDDVYGNLATRPGANTCDDRIGTTLAASASTTCSFTGSFTGSPGDSQTDTVTAVATDAGGNTATDTDDATVTITNAAPTVNVDKSASPLTRPEPGGSFTFNVVVTNTSVASDPVTITSLIDDVYGNIATQGTCTTAVGTVLAPGGTYSCSFTGNFTGDAGDTQTDTVAVTVVDDEGSQANDTDDATVTLTDVPPTLDVLKTPVLASQPEPGGSFRFNIVVTNTSYEPVTVTGLDDDVYGNLNGRGTCALGATIAPGGTYSCSFVGRFTGNAGESETDIVTATVTDNDGSSASDTDNATVSITNAAPSIDVTKTASPSGVAEPGGNVTFTVTVTNTSASTDPVTITSITDNVYGDLDGRGSCNDGVVIAPGDTYTCTFVEHLSGIEGDVHTDTVTVNVTDDEGSPASDSDTATVNITEPRCFGRRPTIITTRGIYAGSGDDVIFVRGDHDIAVHGGSGNDYICGGAGDERLHGGSGSDYISGGPGNDILVGGSGNDRLQGGAGTDRARGDSGTDICSAESTVSCERT